MDMKKILLGGGLILFGGILTPGIPDGEALGVAIILSEVLK
jgi:hypothetical protein